ncbi:MAG TPA: leucine-rich repeat domain-containing protein [Paludibacter sp.]
MKKIVSILTLCMAITVLQAQVSKTVNVTAATLYSLLTDTEKNSITNLTLTGTINACDFKTMRDNMPALAVLDMSGVSIAAYNGTGGTYSTSSTTYPANEIPIYAFYTPSTGSGKTSLTKVILPLTATSIGICAFEYCSGLTGDLTIPNSITSIGKYAFIFCKGFNGSLTIPNSVTTIGDYAFWGCSGLTGSLTIPGSITSIGNYVFNGCSGITGSLTIPNTVTSIGYRSFEGCYGFTGSLTIPNSVVSIGIQAFNFCEGLTSITISKSVTSIGENAFNCKGLTSIYTYSTTPVDLSSSSYVFVLVNHTTCILYVPMGSKTLYQAADQWKDFVNIVESPTAIPNINMATIHIYTNHISDGFYISNIDGTALLQLTNLNGKVLLTKQVETNEFISLSSQPRGVYIVTINTPQGIMKRKIIKE